MSFGFNKLGGQAKAQKVKVDFSASVARTKCRSKPIEEVLGVVVPEH